MYEFDKTLLVEQVQSWRAAYLMSVSLDLALCHMSGFGRLVRRPSQTRQASRHVLWICRFLDEYRILLTYE